MANNAQRKEVGDTQWANHIVRRYEAGELIPEVSKQAAVNVLGLRPGTLVRRGKQPAFDRMRVVAGDRDDE